MLLNIRNLRRKQKQNKSDFISKKFREFQKEFWIDKEKEKMQEFGMVEGNPANIDRRIMFDEFQKPWDLDSNNEISTGGSDSESSNDDYTFK